MNKKGQRNMAYRRGKRPIPKAYSLKCMAFGVFALGLRSIIISNWVGPINKRFDYRNLGRTMDA